MGIPINKASKIALTTVIEYIERHAFFDEIRFVLFSESDLEVYENSLKKLTL